MDSDIIFKSLVVDKNLLLLLCTELSDYINYIAHTTEIQNYIVVEYEIINEPYIPNQVMYIRLYTRDTRTRYKIVTIHADDIIEYYYVHHSPTLSMRKFFIPFFNKTIRKQKIRSIIC